MTRALVVGRKQLTDSLMRLSLLPSEPYTFKPGQYCTIGVDGIERAYSIVSAPYQQFLELFVELVPDGQLTPKLWELDAVSPVSLRPKAKGVFLLDTNYINHFMVSTVTGIAPFVSMVRHYLHNEGKGHRFYILQGASYQDEFGYLEELRGLSEVSHPEAVIYVPTISRQAEARNEGWEGELGRVNYIVEAYVEEYKLKPESTLVYACGHPGMIEDVKAKLMPEGFKVLEERFWKQ